MELVFFRQKFIRDFCKEFLKFTTLRFVGNSYCVTKRLEYAGYLFAFPVRFRRNFIQSVNVLVTIIFFGKKLTCCQCITAFIVLAFFCKRAKNLPNPAFNVIIIRFRCASAFKNYCLKFFIPIRRFTKQIAEFGFSCPAVLRKSCNKFFADVVHYGYCFFRIFCTGIIAVFFISF